MTTNSDKWAPKICEWRIHILRFVCWYERLWDLSLEHILAILNRKEITCVGSKSLQINTNYALLLKWYSSLIDRRRARRLCLWHSRFRLAWSTHRSLFLPTARPRDRPQWSIITSSAAGPPASFVENHWHMQ